MTGYSRESFGPYDLITREQAALTLYRAAGKPVLKESIAPPYLDDSKVSNWALSAIIWAYWNGNGIMHGYGNRNQFGPQDSLTRSQCATILAQRNGDHATSLSDGMKWAIAHGVIHGWPGSRGLDSNGQVDRAQMAQILVNASHKGLLY